MDLISGGYGLNSGANEVQDVLNGLGGGDESQVMKSVKTKIAGNKEMGKLVKVPVNPKLGKTDK